MEKTCPNCGKTYYYDVKKCADCGHVFTENPESEVGEGTPINEDEGNNYLWFYEKDETAKEEAAEPKNEATEEIVVTPSHPSQQATSIELKTPQQHETIDKAISKLKQNKGAKIFLIILGAIILISVIIAASSNITYETIDNDFSERTKYTVNELSFSVPKSWELENDKTTFTKEGDDGTILVRMNVFYDGETKDKSTTQVLDEFEEGWSEFRKIGQPVGSIDGILATASSDPESKAEDRKLYAFAFECDGSIFSVKFDCVARVYNEKVFEDIISAIEVDSYKNPKVLESIEATYDGDTSAGTVLDFDNDYITVTANYSNGDSEEIYDYKIENPVTLKADKESEVVIEYEGKTCTLKVKCTTVSKAAYKAKCKTYSYDKLSRNPDKYEGKHIKASGVVLQVQEGDLFTYYRVGTRNKYDDVVFVSFIGDSSNRILEDDHVTIYGEYSGLYTYESVLGAEITIPKIYAEYIE